ncbi:hypothetical protein ACOME3_002795 [Neoechinorhynchus agilis]
MFKKLVQIGRVCYVIDGEWKDRFVMILELIDDRKVIVDSPGLPKRKVIHLRNLHLTKFRVPVPRTIGHRALIQMWKDKNIREKIRKTQLYTSVVTSRKRREMNDFDRYKKYLAKRRLRLRTIKRMAFIKKHLGVKRDGRINWENMGELNKVMSQLQGKKKKKVEKK